MIPESELQSLHGQTVNDTSGQKIGRVEAVFLDDQTGQPEWMTVNTGLFGSRETFIPLAEAELVGDGVTVPYDKAKVKDAPNMDAAEGHLSQQQEAELYSYYGLNYSEAPSDSGLPTGTTGTVDTTVDTDTVETGTVGRDTSGPTTDDAMTRSEERLRVGTEKVETGRARLRKYLVTEDVSQTVPVTREQVRVEREPITDANMGQAMSGPAFSEEEHEVTLTEERPVVEKEAVPVERVRLSKEQVTEQETVSDTVRSERIETDGGVYPDDATTDSTTERADRI